MSYFRTTYEGNSRYDINFYTNREDNFELVEKICKEAVKKKYSSFTTSYSCGMYGVEFSTDKKETFLDIQELCRNIVDAEDEEERKNFEESPRRRMHRVEYEEEMRSCCDDDDCDEEECYCDDCGDCHLCEEEEIEAEEEGNSCGTCMYHGSNTDNCNLCYDYCNYEDDPLIKYAKDELRRITRIGDEYQERMNKDILELIKVISKQGHSGFSVNCVLDYFNRLARYKPLSPLTGEDDEWHEATSGLYQNKRYSAVFKDKDGKAFNIEGKVFSDDGKSWFQSGQSRVEVTFPYTVPDEPEKVILVPKEEKKEE